MRVPTPDVSIVDLTAELDTDVTVERVNDAFRDAANSSLNGILVVSDEPLVSTDYIGNPASAIVDSLSTFVIDGTLIKVMAWYDNEWGYSCRCVDLGEYIGR
jgi:glyceraldehyde 3-phosphate dehydrogenase